MFHNTDEAKVQLQQNINNGKALEIFAKMVSSLGGPTDFVENTEKYLPQSPLKLPVFANTSGYVNAMNTRNIGLSIIELKGGRINPEQKIDYSTGYSAFSQIGDYVDEQTPLAFDHAANEEDYEKAAKSLQNNIIIGEKTPLLGKNVFEVIE